MDQSEVRKLEIFCKKVRQDIIRMVYEAQSGHIGGSLSAVEIISVLYKHCLLHYPDWSKNPNFEKRDRFVLSKGHASAVLYSVLAHCGYFPEEELRTFRKFSSRLQGHPSYNILPGIEVSTGSLGQGVSIGCGIALGLKLDKNPAKVIVYTGDGELQEGNIWEGIMNACHHKLDNLIIFVDRNKLQIDGSTENIKSLGNLAEKFAVFGCNTFEIDGHNPEMIYNTYQKAKQSDKPVVIIANTIKGKGVSFMENNAGWHGKPPKKEDYERAMAELGAI